METNRDHIGRRFALAFDTANETIAVSVGFLDTDSREVVPVASVQERAHRASNTRLLPIVDELLSSNGLSREGLACVCVGAGPGSFTGVRIAMSTAKGIASALEIPLVAVSTLNSIAQGAWAAGYRGNLLVVGDAMRKEVYPACFGLDDAGIRRLTPDAVMKAMEFSFDMDAFDGDESRVPVLVAGDALRRHADTIAESASSAGVALDVLPEDLWEPRGDGLLLELQHVWRDGDDILDGIAHDPMVALPVYTRLSDAEENERVRLADCSARDLRTGVQGTSTVPFTARGVDLAQGDGAANAVPSTESANAADSASDNGAAIAPDALAEVEFLPFDAAFAGFAADMESAAMGTDAWSADALLDDLSREGRSWWMALDGGTLVGYAGGLVAGDDMQLLKVAVASSYRRRGIAAELIRRLAEDSRNLAVSTMSLEVRKSNSGAQALYESLGFSELGVRPRYYSDGEDALIMSCGISRLASPGLAGLKVVEGAGSNAARLSGKDRVHPLILAIESSCDETAAAVVDGCSGVLSDVVASQIDFHARFGGVVPEIASRKHVEAIAGVARMALEDVAEPISWRNLDAIAVTYAPGLVGALVVGVAFAKGVSWALDIPLIGVNHLEGHLYANKLSSGFNPPAVVSLVSGGNTMLVHMRDWQDYEILGETIDDAVGEAFDKVAKTLGLPYPGGPHISRLAAEGDPSAIDFPRALMHSGDYRFSLSGLKTAVMVYVSKLRDAGDGLNLPDICASFQQAVVDVQVEKARRALRETGAGCLCIGGGVAANPVLRSSYEAMCAQEGASLLMPPLSACGDNAVMIGLVAQDRFSAGAFMGLDGDAQAHADLSEPY